MKVKSLVLAIFTACFALSAFAIPGSNGTAIVLNAFTNARGNAETIYITYRICDYEENLNSCSTPILSAKISPHRLLAIRLAGNDQSVSVLSTITADGKFSANWENECWAHANDPITIAQGGNENGQPTIVCIFHTDPAPSE